MKLKDKIKGLTKDFKNIVEDYHITLILIAVNTLLLVVAPFENETYMKCVLCIILTNVLVFVTDTIMKNKNKKIPLYILSLIFSIISTIIFFKDGVSNRLVMTIVGLYVASFIYSIYVIASREKSLSKFASNLFYNNIVLGISASIIQTGVMFIVFIIESLLFNFNDSLELFLRAEILVLGLYMIPGEIICLLYNKNDKIKAVKILIGYITLPLLLIAEAVIYIYFVKILITNNIPSNQIFVIISCLYIASLPVWIIIDHYKKENNFFLFCSKYLPYIFIPILLLQIYSVGIRVIDYGLTTDRYLGIMLVVFEIISIILIELKNRKYVNYIILTGSIMSIILLCIPFINMYDAPLYNQLSRLKSVYKENTDFNKLSGKDKAIAVAAYRYVVYNANGKDKIPFYIDKSLIDKQPYDYYRDIDYKEINYYNRNDFVNVYNYQAFKSQNVEEYSYNKGIEVKDLRLDNLDFAFRSRFRDYIYSTIVNGKVYSTIININDEYDYYVISCNIRYDEDYKVYSLFIGGYLLKK